MINSNNIADFSHIQLEVFSKTIACCGSVDDNLCYLSGHSKGVDDIETLSVSVCITNDLGDIDPLYWV